MFLDQTNSKQNYLTNIKIINKKTLVDEMMNLLLFFCCHVPTEGSIFLISDFNFFNTRAGLPSNIAIKSKSNVI